MELLIKRSQDCMGVVNPITDSLLGSFEVAQVLRGQTERTFKVLAVWGFKPTNKYFDEVPPSERFETGVFLEDNDRLWVTKDGCSKDRPADI
ncbi:MAG: hypothetical protein WBC93_13170 [Sulfitobacter sp.]